MATIRDRMLLIIIVNYGIKIINERDRTLFVKYFITVLSGILAVLLISVFVTQAYAADLSAGLNPWTDDIANASTASYIGVRTLTLQYPAGSSLAQELDGKNQRVEFSLNSTTAGQNDTGMSGLIAALNRAFVQADSPVQASQAFVSYSGVLRGGPTSTVISYRVDLQPTLEKYLLQTGETDETNRVVDLE